MGERTVLQRAPCQQPALPRCLVVHAQRCCQDGSATLRSHFGSSPLHLLACVSQTEGQARQAAACSAQDTFGQLTAL